MLDPLLLVCLFLSLFAVVFCWRGAATRGFEYDELWMLRHYARKAYAGEIFRDLRVPNNHPLYSLLVRYAVGQGGDSELRTRLPSLVAGIGLLVVLFPCFCRWTGNREASLVAFAWCLLSAPVLYYAQAARGYELQAFLVVLFALLTVEARSNANAERWWLGSAVAVGVAAMLTLPTSILYLVPIAGCDLAERAVRLRRAGPTSMPTLWKRDVMAVAAYLVLFTLAGWWLMYGFGQLVKARSAFGAPMTSVSVWLSFSAAVWSELFGGTTAVLILGGLWLSKRSASGLSLAFVMFFPFLLAPLTCGGPSRVYLPLMPFGMMAAATGICRLSELSRTLLRGRRRQAFLVVVALLPLVGLRFALRRWTPSDWRKVVPALQEKLSKDVFINYPSTAGYVIRHYYFPQIAWDISRRVPTGTEFTLAQIGDSQHLSAVDPRTGNSVDLSVMPGFAMGTETLAGVTVTYYRAVRLESLEGTQASVEGGVTLAAIGPDTPAAVRRLAEALCGDGEHCGWVALDALLDEVFVPTGTSLPTAGVLLASIDRPLAPAQMRQVSIESGGKIRFYYLKRAG
jgi:hypothetical protein